MSKINFIDAPEKLKQEFSFLVSNFGFELITDESKNFGCKLEYEFGEIRLYLFYDFRENFFNFCFVRGSKTKVPNDNDPKNIKTFFQVFNRYEPELTLNSIEPNSEGYELALKRNVELLKKYSSQILREYEWVEL
jgi:hypothetical protein